MRCISLVLLIGLLASCQAPAPRPPATAVSTAPPPARLEPGAPPATLAPGTLQPVAAASPTPSVMAVSPTPPATLDPNAPPPARVYVEPAVLKLGMGQSARVRVIVDGVQKLAGVEVYLAYDPVQLEIQDEDTAQPNIQVQLGDLIAPDFIAIHEVKDGRVSAVFLQMPPHQAVTGSGQLLAFTLVARQVGTSQLSLEEVKLASPDGTKTPVLLEHGQVIVQ